MRMEFRCSAAPRSARRGLDYVVLRAMVADAICWQWPRTAAALVAVFFGLKRLGELAAFGAAISGSLSTALALTECFALFCP